MAGTETTYHVAVTSPLILAVGRAQTTQLVAERAGALVEPTAATCVLLDATGQTVASPTVSVVASIAQAVYSPTAFDTLGTGGVYVESWTLTLATVERKFRRTVQLASYELQPPVRQLDLVAGEYPDLVDGLGDYATSLQAFADTTWAGCVRLLSKRGIASDMLVEPSDVYDLYRHEVLARVFKASWKQPGDRAHELWQYHRAEALAARSGLTVVLDRDRDAIPDDSGQRQPTARTIQPNAPARTRMPRSFRW